MKILKYLIFLIPISLILISGCKSNIQPEKPTQQVNTLKYENELSQLNIPIEVSLSNLERKVNQQIGTVLYKDDSFTNNDNDGVKVEITKRGTIKLNANSNVLHYKVPLNVKVTARKVIVGFEAIKSTEFEVDFDFKSEIDINRKWGLITKTQCTDYKLITEPKINFGPITLNLSNIVSFVVNESKELMSKELDTQLKENFDARSYVLNTWIDLQKPIHISEEYNSWLLVEPKKLFMTSIKTSRRRLILNIGIKTYTEVLISKEEPKVKINENLPDLIKVTTLSPGFNISLGSVISYSDATHMLQQNLKGYIYEEGNRKVEITDVETSGNGDKLVLKIDFLGSYRGTMYMTGIPKYDNESQTVFIDDFDFDIKTKQALLKVGGWLLHGTFKKKIIEYSTISLAQQIEEGRKLAQESLNKNQMTDDVKLECKIKSITPKGIYLNKEGIQTIIYIQGESKVKI